MGKIDGASVRSNLAVIAAMLSKTSTKGRSETKKRQHLKYHGQSHGAGEA
jgi:hypothetical protein